MSKAAAAAHKEQGNNFFKQGKYEQAIAGYTRAIESDATDPTFFSNRAACFAALGRWQESADDARQCVTLDRTFIKAYFRLGFALQNLGNIDDAIDAIARGLGVDAANADLKKKMRELEELQRQGRVTALVVQAEQQVALSDWSGALRTIESGVRLDSENSALVRLKAVCQPRFEQEEKRRRASLSSTERLKEEGDKLYNDAKFEDAIRLYTRCLDATADKRCELAIKCFSNRSACYKQLSNFDGIIGDTTAVLEVEPENIKCLIRRAQALEAMERYRSALDDIRLIMSYGEVSIGGTNWGIVNGMQNRLNRAVGQLRSG